MISVIIASADKELLQQVRQNIDDTVGVPYEVLAFDNADGRKGMCEIYNLGIAKARFELLCFMHEDLAMQTKDWGKLIVDIFRNNKNLGVVGVAGSTYKSATPGGWLPDSDVETEYSNLIQSFKYDDHETLHHYRNRDHQKLAKVVSVDGVWFCVPGSIAKQIRFDEKTFQRFHCYDVDFCLSVNQQYDVAVTFDILLHHFSEGRFDAGWMNEVLKLHEKWSAYLPVYTEPFSLGKISKIESQCFRRFIKRLVGFNFPVRVAYRAVAQGRNLYKKNVLLFARFHFYILKYFFLKKRP